MLCENSDAISRPTSIQRSAYDKSHQRIPLLDSKTSRSLLIPSIYFVGFDMRKDTITLGHQGFAAGVSISTALKKYSEDIIPKGSVSVTDSSTRQVKAALQLFGAGMAVATIGSLIFLYRRNPAALRKTKVRR